MIHPTIKSAAWAVAQNRAMVAFVEFTEGASTESMERYFQSEADTRFVFGDACDGCRDHRARRLSGRTWAVQRGTWPRGSVGGASRWCLEAVTQNDSAFEVSRVLGMDELSTRLFYLRGPGGARLRVSASGSGGRVGVIAGARRVRRRERHGRATVSYDAYLDDLQIALSDQERAREADRAERRRSMPLPPGEIDYDDLIELRAQVALREMPGRSDLPAHIEVLTRARARYPSLSEFSEALARAYLASDAPERALAIAREGQQQQGQGDALAALAREAAVEVGGDALAEAMQTLDGDDPARAAHAMRRWRNIAYTSRESMYLSSLDVIETPHRVSLTLPRATFLLVARALVESESPAADDVFELVLHGRVEGEAIASRDLDGSVARRSGVLIARFGRVDPRVMAARVLGWAAPGRVRFSLRRIRAGVREAEVQFAGELKREAFTIRRSSIQVSRRFDALMTAPLSAMQMFPRVLRVRLSASEDARVTLPAAQALRCEVDARDLQCTAVAEGYEATWWSMIEPLVTRVR